MPRRLPGRNRQLGNEDQDHRHDEREQADRLFHALADATRRDIVRRVIDAAEDPRTTELYGWVRYHLTAGDKRAWYAHLVEFGTVKMAAQPFFRPAFDESKDNMADAAVIKLKEGLARR